MKKFILSCSLSIMLCIPALAQQTSGLTSSIITIQPQDGIHSLTIRPLNPVVVFHKIIIDDGGYEQTHLKMRESPYERE